MFDYRKRQKKFYNRLRRGKKIPFLFTSLVDIRYLTGFTGSSSILLIDDHGFTFATDGRYEVQSRDEVKADSIVIFHSRSDCLGKLLPKGSPIHFDRDNFPYSDFSRLHGLGYDPKPVRSPLSNIRKIKSREEVLAIERAAILASISLMSAMVKAGRKATEKELSALIEYEMKQRSAEDVSFPPIVASGDRTAMPHATPGKHRLGDSSLLLIDFGCRVNGYCSDETITLLKPGGIHGREMKKVFETVRKAQMAALSKVKGRMKCREVDRAAREVIREKGYAAFFPHSTGHGVGLNVHEAPSISPRSNEVLKPGMVITVEPGIYIPGKGGVRLEDLVVVTEDGYEKITYFPKEWGKGLVEGGVRDVFNI